METSLYIGIAIGFVPSFILLLITQYYQWERANRHLILEKYERAFSALNNENIDLIRTFDELPDLNSNITEPNFLKIRSTRVSSMRESKIALDKVDWFIAILPVYDKSLTPEITKFGNEKREYEAYALDLLDKMIDYTRKEDDIKKFREIENKYKMTTVNLLILISDKMSLKYENPFAKTFP